MFPFTAEQFLGVFEKYNQAVFPMQVVAYLLGLLAIVFILNRRSDQVVSGILAFMWLWNGVTYHIVFFSPINKAAFGFGTLFIFEGLLLAWAGCLDKSIGFKYPLPGFFSALGFAAIAYSMIIYPALGIWSGHGYPRAPMFGIAPCPTTIFTFGLLLWSTPRLPRYLIIIPLLWSVIGFGAAMNFGIKEDIGLLITGVIASALILIRDRISKKEMNLAAEEKS